MLPVETGKCILRWLRGLVRRGVKFEVTISMQMEMLGMLLSLQGGLRLLSLQGGLRLENRKLGSRNKEMIFKGLRLKAFICRV